MDLTELVDGITAAWLIGMAIDYTAKLYVYLDWKGNRSEYGEVPDHDAEFLRTNRERLQYYMPFGHIILPLVDEAQRVYGYLTFKDMQ